MKIFRVLRSMTFALVLLMLIILCSLAGSLIPQGKELAYYQHFYGDAAGIITALKLDNVFSSFYFIALLVLLGANLIFCSLIRVKNVSTQVRTMGERLEKAKLRPYSQTQESFKEELKADGYKQKTQDGISYYSKNALGYWGSFLTHLAFLLILILGGAMLYFSDVQDIFILPGEYAALSDGVQLHVDSFQIADDTGHPDYRALIRVQDTNGVVSDQTEISVNNPFTYAGHTYYQQSYATAGSASIIYQGQTQQVYMTEPLFFSPDGKNGFSYAGIQEAHGQIIYHIIRLENGTQSGEIAMPGDTLSIAGMDFKLNPPVPYPGIRAKASPPLVLELLYFTFLLIIAALYLAFFHTPSAVIIKEAGFGLVAPKPDALPDFLNNTIERE